MRRLPSLWGTNDTTNNWMTNFQKDMDIMSKEMDSIYRNFFGDRAMAKEFKMLGEWSPTMNVSETEKEFKVTAELPGLEDKDVELTFQDNTLCLKGEKKIEKETKEENFHRIESSFGTFQRRFTFPTEINAEKIAADFKNGVLTVRLEKAPESIKGARKIAIRGN